MLASGISELVYLELYSVLSSSRPDMRRQQWYVQVLVDRFSWTTSNEIVLPFTMVFATTALLTAFVRLMNLWLN